MLDDIILNQIIHSNQIVEGKWNDPEIDMHCKPISEVKKIDKNTFDLKNRFS